MSFPAIESNSYTAATFSCCIFVEDLWIGINLKVLQQGRRITRGRSGGPRESCGVRFIMRLCLCPGVELIILLLSWKRDASQRQRQHKRHQSAGKLGNYNRTHMGMAGYGCCAIKQ